jgi:hypothetical protein
MRQGLCSGFILSVIIVGCFGLPAFEDLSSASFLQTGASTNQLLQSIIFSAQYFFLIPPLFFFNSGLTGSGLGSLNLTSLTINSGKARESRIVLGSGEGAFTLALTADGSFVIRHRGLPSFTVGPEGDVTVNGKVKSSGVMRVDNSLKFMGVHQWLLAANEDFNVVRDSLLFFSLFFQGLHYVCFFSLSKIYLS